MLRELAAYPVVLLLSLLVALVGWIGGVAGRLPVTAWIYEWLIGFETAKERRDEHEEALVGAVEAHDIEYKRSKQALVQEIRNNRRRSVSRISRGESVLSVTIALIAVTVESLPASVRLLSSVSVPLPTVDALLLGLTVVLVASVSFRQVAIRVESFREPTVFDSYDRLLTKWAWNKSTYESSKSPARMLSMEIIRQLHPRLYEIYLELMADVVRGGGMSRMEAMRHYWEDSIMIRNDLFGLDTPESGESAD